MGFLDPVKVEPITEVTPIMGDTVEYRGNLYIVTGINLKQHALVTWDLDSPSNEYPDERGVNPDELHFVSGYRYVERLK